MATSNQEITLRYRKQGQVQTVTFTGQIMILDEDRYTPVVIPEDRYPQRGIDLTTVPVIAIGGRDPMERMRSFLSSNAEFEGAFFMGGSGYGTLVVTDLEILEGRRRVSGGRPEEQWVNHRFMRDGRYVADWASVLHSKTLKVLQVEVEQDAGAEVLAKKLAQYWGSSVNTSLAEMVQGVVQSVSEFTTRLQRETGDQLIAEGLVAKVLQARLEGLGVQRISQIPEDFQLMVEEVVPELWAQRETLGMVDIPGLGLLELSGRQAGHPMVTLTIDQVRQVIDWPFSQLLLKVKELESRYPVGVSVQWDRVETNHPILQEGPDRWPTIRGQITKWWEDFQRAQNWPKEQKVSHPRNEDPVLPEPVEWGITLDGEVLVAYPALAAPGRLDEWLIKWFAIQPEADEANKVGFAAAAPFVQARLRREALLASGESGEEVPFPVIVPEKPQDNSEASRDERSAAQVQYEQQVREVVETFLRRPECVNLPLEMLAQLRNEYGSASQLLRSLEAAREQWSDTVRLYNARKAAEAAGELWLDVEVRVSTESRTFTDVWVIAPDGSIIKPIAALTTDGRKSRTYGYNYGDLPTDYLVVGHSHNNYGYQETEVWEVHRLPSSVTEAQRVTLAELTDKSVVYYRAPGATKNAPTWDLSRVGSVIYTTEYSRDFVGDRRDEYDAMCAAMPVDPQDYRCQAKSTEEGLIITVTAQKRFANPEANPMLAALQQAGLVNEVGESLFEAPEADEEPEAPDEGAEEALRSAQAAWADLFEE